MLNSAFFDLDNTLIAGDSDYLWGEFLADADAVPAAEFREKNQRFLKQYQHGQLNAEEFLAFQLYPLSLHPISRLKEWRCLFLKQIIEPLVLPKALALVAEHLALGHQLILATSTNSFITRPIAGYFGIEHLIAAEPEIVAGKFTGRVNGQASFGPAKLKWAQNWLKANSGSLKQSWFYSDSHTDLPLLSAVGHAIAVDANEQLGEVAQARGWRCVSLR